MPLNLRPYPEQAATWPARGRHILAQFDEATVVVYQAYRPSIGLHALEHQRFGGDFSFTRMSWIKPNFLWMMYRCGWGTKPDQECILAVTLRREGFDAILRGAVPSTFAPGLYETPEDWSRAVRGSDVRLQWDPDHLPSGHPVERRAIQLGLRGEALKRYARDWIVRIDDATPIATAGREALESRGKSALLTPAESAYPIDDPEVRARLGMEEPAQA